MPHIYITLEKIFWKAGFPFYITLEIIFWKLVIPLVISFLSYYQYKSYELKKIGFLVIENGYIFNQKSDFLIFLIFIIININLLFGFKKLIRSSNYLFYFILLNAYAFGIYFNIRVEVSIAFSLVILLLNYIYLKNKLLEYILIILFIALVHIFLFSAISPFNQISVFESMTGRLDAYQPIVTNYIENIKVGSIFNNLNQRGNFGSEVYYPLSSSYFYEIISIFIDYIRLEFSYIIIYENIKTYTYTLIVFCSIGTYLLFRNEFNNNIFISVLAALLVIYGNSAFIGYQGNENYHQLAEYIIFPWALLALFHGVNNNKLIYIYISGFILGVSLLIMRSSFEFRFISVIFLGITLILVNLHNLNFKGVTYSYRKHIYRIFILALGYLSSAMIDIIPLIGGILSGDLSIFQPHKFNGFNWKEGYLNLTAFLFEYPIEKIYNFPPDEVGRNSGLYKGPIFSLIIISTILYLIINIKYIFFEKKIYIAYSLILITILISISNGENALFSILSKYIGFGRVHFQSRLIVYYNLYLLFLFIFVINKILYFKNSFEYIVSGYIIYIVILLMLIYSNEVIKDHLQWSVNLIFILLLILYKKLINFKFYLLFPIVFIIFTSVYKSNVGVSDLYKISSSQFISLSNEVLCLKEDVDGIRRYSINPLCQNQNTILNQIDEHYQRYLYVYSSQLPSINSKENSKLVNVADSSVYSYGGSPIFPSNLGVAYLTELFPFSKNSMALDYNFDLYSLNSKNYRDFLDWISVKYILIEKGSKISDSQLNYVSSYYNIIYDDYRYRVLKSMNASDFIFLSAIEDKQTLNQLLFNYSYQYMNFDLYKSQFQNDIFKYFLAEKNYFSHKNLVKSDNGKYITKELNFEDNKLDILSLTGSKALFNIKCQSKCIIVVNNVFLKDYSAVSSNKNFEIIPVNYGRIGIVIPNKFSGDILLQYENIYKIYGTLFLLACLLIIIILL